LIRRVEIDRVVRSAVDAADAVILRVPSAIGGIVQRNCARTGSPYSVEVVGDPYSVFAPGAVGHPLRTGLRWWFTRDLRRQCAGACAAAYVTRTTLQLRYPARRDALTTDYSSIVLNAEAFVRHHRVARSAASALQLVSVGSLDQLYKGPDVLIDAVAKCVEQGLDLKLVWVGDGKHRRELEDRAAALGLSGHVRFAGQLGRDAVFAHLDRADLFVLPSRTEGLPRAMIEAMARALPCIGSSVGGIPELLSPDDMVPPGDASRLARRIAQVVGDSERMTRMSARNLEKAREYNEETLRARRLEFYSHVREATERWARVAGTG
jgi:glycosyltransferase involved in cell wall biosynthesis